MNFCNTLKCFGDFLKIKKIMVKKILSPGLLILIVVMIYSCTQDLADVSIWELPDGFPESEKFRVTVNGKHCPVIHSDPATDTHFAYFDFEGGNVEITVTSRDKNYFLNGCRIKPTTKQIKPIVKKNKATFSITSPCKISIENPDFNYRDMRGKGKNLIILAGTPQKNIPSKDDPSVIWLESGLHKENIVIDKPGQTLYIDGGAILMGSINVLKTEDIRIIGRGVVIFDDMTFYDKDYGPLRRPSSKPLTVLNSRNITVEGIKLVPRSRVWTTVFSNSSGLKIIDIGIFADNRWDLNGDGLNLRCCSDIIIRDCFIRSDDDAIALSPHNPDEGNETMKNILVEDCVIWNATSNVVRLGGGSKVGAVIDGFTLRNIENIHGSYNVTRLTFPTEFHGLFMNSTLTGKNMTTFKNFTIENINIENHSCLLVFAEPNMKYQSWTLKNISLDDPGIYQSLVWTEHIDGITFSNLRIGGRLITHPDDANFSADSKTDKIKFEADVTSWAWGFGGPY